METLEEIIGISDRLVDNEKYTEAIEMLSGAIARFPDAAEAYDLRGVAWFRMLKLPDAIEDCKACITIDPGFHIACFHLGEIYMHQSDFSTAEKYYQKALAIEPGNAHYEAMIAYAKFYLKEYNECIRLCNEMLDVHANNPHINHLFLVEYRAHSYMELKMYDKAVLDYQTVYTNQVEDSILLNNLGYCYSKTGNLSKAKSHLSKAIEIDPGFSYSWDNLGYVYLLERNFEKAHELIDKSIELDPGNSYAFKNKALVYIAEKKNDEAILSLEKAKALRFDLYYGDEVNLLLENMAPSK